MWETEGLGSPHFSVPEMFLRTKDVKKGGVSSWIHEKKANLPDGLRVA
jgi:hypothetical protein